jgi:phytoene dehydrogenase-like protein
MSDSFDAVVVGAGPNGLTAAARLARAGRRVIVFEGAPTVGGSARTQELLTPGVRHDLGAAVVPFAALSPAFATLRLDLPLRHGPTPLAHAVDDRRAVALERSLDATADALGSDGARYRRLLGPFVEHIDALADASLGPATRQARHPLVAARFGPLALAPATALARLFATDDVRAVLVGLGAHATVAPDRMLTGGVALMLLAALHAVGWPVVEGGTQVVAERLADVVRACGGEIVLDHRVASLHELPPAAITILDVTPHQFVALAPDAAPAYRRWHHGPGACKVDYVLSGPMPWSAAGCRQAATVHIGGSAIEIVAAERAIAAGQIPDRPYAIVVQPHVADPSRRLDEPRRALPMWAYCHVPNGCDVDASPSIEAQLDRVAPGWRDLIVAKQVTTAAASEAVNPNLVGGDIAGGLMTTRQMLLGPRPGRSPYTTNLDGVYLCSSSTPPGAGVHGMCGWHAAGTALRRSRPAGRGGRRR